MFGRPRQPAARRYRRALAPAAPRRAWSRISERHLPACSAGRAGRADRLLALRRPFVIDGIRASGLGMRQLRRSCHQTGNGVDLGRECVESASSVRGADRTGMRSTAGDRQGGAGTATCCLNCGGPSRQRQASLASPRSACTGRAVGVFEAAAALAAAARRGAIARRISSRWPTLLEGRRSRYFRYRRCCAWRSIALERIQSSRVSRNLRMAAVNSGRRCSFRASGASPAAAEDSARRAGSCPSRLERSRSPVEVAPS